MKNRKVVTLFLAVILSLSMILSATACSPKEETPVETNTQNAPSAPVAPTAEAPKKEEVEPAKPVKDSVILAITGEPSSLDSMKANDLNTFSIQCNLYDSLLRQEQDGSLVPGLAESWEYNADKTEITFKLREGVKFHNGDTMTADDVVFSYDRALASPNTARITASMKKMEKVDDQHVKLTLNYAYGPIESCLASVNTSIVSKAAAEANPDGFARNPVGTGPYKFDSWASGSKIVFKAFEDYFREPARIKTLTYQLVTDPSAALIALETGDVDMIVSTMAADRANIMGNKDLYYDEVPSSSFYFVAFNNSTGLFAENPKLRQAVAHAIDRQSVVIGATEGVGVECPSPIPATCFGTPEGFEGATYDPELAKKLMAEAGFPNGVKLNIRTMESGVYAKVAEIVAEQLRQVGFDAQVELMERTAFLQDVYTKSEYEICVNSYTALNPDADFIMYMRYHSKYMGGGNNFVMVSNPTLDGYLETGRFSADSAERKEAYRKAAELMKEEAVMVPILSTMNGVACRADLKGVKANTSQKQYVYDFYWE
jgi:peptide/nickel transport system substrate-binding protein